MRLQTLAPLLAAVAAAWLFDLSRMATAALIGAALALAMIAAQRPVTLRFAALAFGAALALGFTAMMLAELIGVRVRDLLEGPWHQHAIARVLAWLAVACAALGVASALYAMARAGSAVDDQAGPPP